MFLKRADQRLERKILMQYPDIYPMDSSEKVYFYLNEDGSHVLEPNGNVKCEILTDSERSAFLKQKKFMVI